MSYALAALLALVIVLALMPRLIEYLKQLKFGQTIYDLGPQAHLSKQGTPNMGGILIAAAAVIAGIVSALWQGALPQLIPMLLASLGALAIGFADDYTKDVKKHHEGLKPREKIIGQVVLGLIYSVFCYVRLGGAVHLPFTSAQWDLGIFYVPVMTVLIIFMTNSANLQDGVDGIMGSVSLLGGLAFGAIALLGLEAYGAEGRAAAGLCFALAGACLGFLKYNRHPARIIMGDTGSMFIGGLLTAVAMQLKLQWWLVPICFTMIMSSLSVIIQRIYFKATKGKRIFRMSPLHHHFELGGMSENRVVGMYALVTLGLSLIAILAALNIH